MLKKRKLALLLLVGMVYASNLNEFIMSTIFVGGEKHYEHTGISPEFFVGFLFIFISLNFLTDEVLFQPLSGNASKIVVIFVLTVFLMSISVFVHADALEELRLLIAFVTMVLYFFIGKGFALSYSEYLAARLWKYIWQLPLVLMVFYVFFWVTGRIEFFSLFTLTRTSSIVEGLKPQVQGGFRSSEMATYVGLSVIFLLYCLHGADKKKSRVILFLLLGLSAAFLFILFSMGAFLAIGAVLGLYMIQKSGTAGLVKAGAVCLVAGLLVGLYSPSSVEVLREKVEEKLSLDLSQTEGGEGNRALRYALLLKTAVDNPVFGVGSQDLLDLVPYSKVKMRSNAPHQNILGIAAGCGVIAAIFYTLFVCTVTWSGFRALCKWDTTRSSASTNMRYLLFMAVGSFLFLQIHGLFLDTWQIKQVYLWAGITLGIVQRLDLNRKREMERSSAWSIQRGLFRRKRWKLA